MRYLILASIVALSWSANADSYQRNIAGKLTEHKKPQVRVMTEDERTVASQSSVAMDLDADPNEIVCRKVRVGNDSASRLKVRRCKSRAEFREEAERNLAITSKEIDDFNRRVAVAQSLSARRIKRIERTNRVRVRTGK